MASFVIQVGISSPSLLAVNGLSENRTTPSALIELSSEVAGTDYGFCSILAKDQAPTGLAKIAGFEVGFAVVSDLIDSNGNRLGLFISVGADDGPSEGHLNACKKYVRQIESSLDLETQRVFMHATSMALRERENLWQDREAALRGQNSELDRVASYAAHELKTPLRSMMFDAEYVVAKLDRALDTRTDGAELNGSNALSINAEEVAEMSTVVQHLYDQAAQLSGQLDDLLFVVRSDNRKPAMEKVDLASLVTNMVHRHRYEISAVDALVDIGQLPTILSNRQFMSIVFSNLISNAVRFRCPDRQLTIRFVCEADDGGVLLSVIDNGLGIAAEHHRRIFGPFQRLDESVEGLGLGLSLCVRLLERLGAELKVTSEPDKGASFTIRIPS